MIQTLGQSQDSSMDLTLPTKAQKAHILHKELLEGEEVEEEVHILLKIQAHMEEEIGKTTGDLILDLINPLEIQIQSPDLIILTFLISFAGCITWTWNANMAKNATENTTIL